MEYFDLSHNDAFVVSMRMINTQVKRVMINIGISIDILYFNSFKKLKLAINDLTLMISSLTGSLTILSSLLGL